MNDIKCPRCGARCQVGPLPGAQAKMLRRSPTIGLCVNCATHDFLRNTYPANILLAEMGPWGLLLPHIQQAFAAIMRVNHADAQPDEIKWQQVVDNWDLPFPNKVRRSPMNPCDDEELNAIKRGDRRGLGQPSKNLEELTKPIRTFEELNELHPGLGNEFHNLLHKMDESNGVE